MDESARNEQRRGMLDAELNHRVKNIFALVKSIVVQTGAHVTTVAEYSAVLQGRLRALAFAHDLSVSAENGGELKTLFETETGLHNYGYAVDRVVLVGPRLRLDSRGFGAMALVLHEMTTNAVKYGALSVVSGRLDISWSCSECGDCVIEWVEQGGPAANLPTRTGFGSTLIRDTMAYDLGGSVEIDYAATGLRARLVIPAHHLQAFVAGQPPEVTAIAGERPLVGMDVLLVEDQLLIAMDTEEALRSLGARSVRSCPNVADALAAIVATAPDCAVLDVILGTESAIAIADELAARNVPFVFATGYSDTTMIPDRFAEIPSVGKPFSAQMLANRLIAAFSAEN